MLVKDVMNTDVEIIEPGESVLKAASCSAASQTSGRFAIVNALDRRPQPAV